VQVPPLQHWSELVQDSPESLHTWQALPPLGAVLQAIGLPLLGPQQSALVVQGELRLRQQVSPEPLLAEPHCSPELQHLRYPLHDWPRVAQTEQPLPPPSKELHLPVTPPGHGQSLSDVQVRTHRDRFATVSVMRQRSPGAQGLQWKDGL
jgi:hypothetical protein